MYEKHEINMTVPALHVCVLSCSDGQTDTVCHQMRFKPA